MSKQTTIPNESSITNKTTMSNEILFFKVIRNVYLFKKIHSNINEYSTFKYGVYKYHQIISVEDMIEIKNFHKLLKYKVKKNQHLSFTYLKLQLTKKKDITNYEVITEPYNNSKLSSFSSLNHKIYSTLKFGQKFYNCLFKFYPNQFEKDLSVWNIKSTINKMIEYDCLGGVMELINNFDCGKLISKEHYILAFNFNSFNVLEYLHNNFKFQINPTTYYYEIKKNTPYHKIFEHNFNKYSTISNMKFLNVNGQIGFLNKILGYNPPNDSYIPSLVYAINLDIRRISLQQLIDTCITVTYLPLKSYIKSIKKYLEPTKEYFQLVLNINEDNHHLSLSINEIYKIKSLFTNEQLLSKLENVIGNQDELGQLFKFILPFIGYGHLLYSNLDYYIKKFIKTINNLNIKPKHLSYRFDIIKSYLKISNSNQDNYNLLLKIINKMDSLGSENIDCSLLLGSIFDLFIEKEDYKSLELLLCKMSLDDIPVNILSHINSETMLQYLYNNQNSKTRIIEAFKNGFGFHYPNILLFYKSLYPNEFQQVLTPRNIPQILGIIESKTDYFVHNLQKLTNIQRKKHEDRCLLIYNCNQLSKLVIPISNFQSTYKQFKFFIENSFYSGSSPNQKLSYSDKLVYIEFTKNEKQFLFNYLCNDYQILFSDISFFFQNSKLLFSVVSQYGDVDCLSNILSTFFSLHLYEDNLQFISLLDTFYVFSCYFNQISIINFIQTNYQHLLFEIDSRTIEFCLSIIKKDPQRSKFLNFLNTVYKK